MRKLIICSILLFLGNTAQSQSVVYYPFNSLLSVSSNPTKPIWLDVRLQTNSFTNSLSTEIAPAINLNKNLKARFYLGGGAKFNFLAAAFQDANPLEGYFINAGFRSALFEKYPGIQIAFELSPYANRDLDLGTFRANLGIGYCFNSKKK